MAKRFTHIIGIDEVGRGPIAGPVAVGAVAIKLDTHCNQPMARDMYQKLFAGIDVKIKDSKKLSPQKRSEVFQYVSRWQKEQRLKYTVSFISSQVIDEIGISRSIYQAICDCLSELNLEPERTLILLDGSLRAPKEYRFQHTIIKGDEKERIIALASIVAKLSRDDVMEQYSLLYPEYQFEEHKGYATHAHYKCVKKYGLSPLHRRSFLKDFVEKLVPAKVPVAA